MVRAASAQDRLELEERILDLVEIRRLFTWRSRFSKALRAENKMRVFALHDREGQLVGVAQIMLPVRPSIGPERRTEIVRAAITTGRRNNGLRRGTIKDGIVCYWRIMRLIGRSIRYIIS
jgi:hypothetical protein